MRYKEKTKYVARKGQNEMKRGITAVVCRDPYYYLETKCKRLTEEFKSWKGVNKGFSFQIASPQPTNSDDDNDYDGDDDNCNHDRKTRSRRVICCITKDAKNISLHLIAYYFRY